MEQLEQRDAGLALRAGELAEAMVRLQELQACCNDQARKVAQLRHGHDKDAGELEHWQRRFNEAVQRGREIYGMLRMVGRGAGGQGGGVGLHWGVMRNGTLQALRFGLHGSQAGGAVEGGICSGGQPGQRPA
jgi:hypothetical protein